MKLNKKNSYINEICEVSFLCHTLVHAPAIFGAWLENPH